MTPPVPPLERVRSLLAGINAHGCRTQVDSDLASILQDYLRRVEADEWQPIETAPRDGTKVQITRVRADGSYEWLYVAWCRRTQWRITENVARNYYSTVDSEPTHWRPLPPPPEADSTALEGEK